MIKVRFFSVRHSLDSWNGSEQPFVLTFILCLPSLMTVACVSANKLISPFWLEKVWLPLIVGFVLFLERLRGACFAGSESPASLLRKRTFSRPLLILA